MRPVIILFAKAPVPGRVKTRLLPAVSADSAALLHSAFVRDAVESLEALGAIADLELHTDIVTDAWPEITVSRKLQHEGDLGLKMFKALEFALHRGHPQALILGSDSPTLPPNYLRALLETEADVAFGPTTDGGYYAISARRVQPEMFHAVRWSTSHALQDTLDACGACGLSLASAPEWFDVDEPADLDQLRRTRSIPPNTAKVLQALDAELQQLILDDATPR